MPSNTPKDWITSHLSAIPALPVYLQQAKKLMHEPHLDTKALSQVMALDPGISSQLFNHVNAKRKGTKRGYLESILSALSLMGEAGIKTFFEQLTSSDKLNLTGECLNDYLQLVARAQHAAAHAKTWGEKRGSQGIKEMCIATKLYDIAEYALCLFDYDNFKDYKQRNRVNFNPAENSELIWGFNLHELSLKLCDELHLPELAIEAHNLHASTGIRTQGIKLASTLSQQAEIDWYDKKMAALINDAATLCQIPLDATTTLIHTTAVQAAQSLDFKVAFHSASNLVQHVAPYRPKVKKEEALTQKITAKTLSPKPTPTPQKKISNGLLSKLIAIAKHPKTNHAIQLNALLKGCHDHLNLSRCALFLISKDKKSLSTRLHYGLDADSSLLKFSLPIAQSGLLKALLDKPQGIWVNPVNFQKYEKMLPGTFKSCTRNNDLFMMSLFSGKQAMGIIYCDDFGSKSTLNKAQFNQFKQAIEFSSKALAFITQRNNKAAKKA